MNPDTLTNLGEGTSTLGDIREHLSDDRIQPNDDNRTHHGSIINERPNKPIGIKVCGAFFKFNSISAKRTCHKTILLCVTFIAYTCYHMGRRPLSIVKNVLNRKCSDIHNVTLYDHQSYINRTNNYSDEDPTWCDWAPFNDDTTANQLLALLDSAFLFSYAIFMFFSGYLADRCNLRYYLSGGMIISGLLLYAFGMSFYLNIHSMSYFVLIQVLSGAVQTTGWPSVVTCIGNWFDRSSRGSVFGVWNANTNIGNIIGATIAGYFVERAWGLSFIVPGFIMLVAGVVTFLFLVPRPQDVGLLSISESKLEDISAQSHREYDIEEAVEENAGIFTNRRSTSRRKLNRSPEDDDIVSDSVDVYSSSEQRPLIHYSGGDIVETNEPTHALSFLACLKIPGVVEYSLSLGFAKLVSYTFLYWLPRWIGQSTINNSESCAYLSVPFDVGGMFGAILAGYLSDRYRMYATICSAMMITAIPAMLAFEKFASISNTYNICLQLITGALVTGPYALITTAVSTDLGGRVKDGKAMATVTAVIDGTGSIGAAIGPLVAGYISDSGWTIVFIMLMISETIASLLLIRITLKELGFR